MYFSLSPYQYHRLDTRKRMAAALNGLSGFSQALEVKDANAARGQLVPTSRAKSLIESTLQAPTVGSGLTPGQYRVQLTPAPDSLDYRDHSLMNLPRLTKAAGSNRTPGWPDVVRFAGLGAMMRDEGPDERGVPGTTAATRSSSTSTTTYDPVEQAQKAAAAKEASTERYRNYQKTLAAQQEAARAAAIAAAAAEAERDELTAKARAEAERKAAQRASLEASKARAAAKATAEAEAKAAAEAAAREVALTISPDAVGPAEDAPGPATVAVTSAATGKSNTLLWVGAAVAGAGVLYFLFKK